MTNTADSAATPAQPLITVIIPVYNTLDKGLERCLDSVMGQTFRDIEILVVDDGSTDGSAALVNRLAHEDHRIRMIRQENQGLWAVRNTGVSAARGRYIMWVDSDDWISPEWVGLFARAMRDADCDITTCPMPGTDAERMRRGVLRTLRGGPSEILAAYLMGELGHTMWVTCIRRTLFDTHPYEAFSIGEDVIGSCWLFGAARSCQVIGAAGESYHYTVRGDSMLHSGDIASKMPWPHRGRRQLEIVAETHPECLPHAHYDVMRGAYEIYSQVRAVATDRQSDPRTHAAKRRLMAELRQLMRAGLLRLPWNRMDAGRRRLALRAALRSTVLR